MVIFLSETIIYEIKYKHFKQLAIEINSFTDILLVSHSFYYSLVNFCITSKTNRVCYGHTIKRLVVPDASCRAAVMYG